MASELGRAGPLLAAALVGTLLLAAVAVAVVVVGPGSGTASGSSPIISDTLQSATSSPSPGSSRLPASAPTVVSSQSARPSAQPGTAPLERPVILPASIAERAELPFCGHETVDRRLDGDFRDPDVRACFLAAHEAGEPAEMITDSPTVEGGPVREIFRILPSGAIESYLDLTQDPLGTPTWTLAICRTLRAVDRDPAGTPAFFPSACDEPEVVVGLRPEIEPTGDEVGTFERLVQFARTSDPELIDDIPFATEGVWLGLADDLHVRRAPEELVEPQAWSLEADAFRGRVGPFSALDVLASWNLGTEAPPVRELAAWVGDHPHCASPPVPAPSEMANLRRVSVQPVRPAACLQWWTVDLFIGRDGVIQAITVDFGEP
ncbi:MAG TPA: hypothetical protein VF365_09530 [Candidatus Limnocylindria bacterium]